MIFNIIVTIMMDSDSHVRAGCRVESSQKTVGGTLLKDEDTKARVVCGMLVDRK